MKNETRVPISRITLRALAILAAAGSINVATIPVQEHFLYDTQASTRFSDDSLIRDYSRSSVESLLATGGIKGYPEDNTFRPQGTITKLEFLSMVVNSLDPDGTKLAEGIQKAKTTIEDGVSNYDDYKSDGLLTGFWGGKAFDLIIGARMLGVGLGYETNATGGNWDTPITRQDAATMIYQGLKSIKGVDLCEIYNTKETWQGGKKLIGDWDELTETDVPGGRSEAVSSCSGRWAILSLYEAGVLQGDSESKYYPNKYLTREDSAIIIEKAVNPDKRAKVTIPEADKVIDKSDGIERTTLKQSDPNRRGAVDGDTFIKADGTSIKVVKDEKSGVIGANQPVALEMGRTLKGTNQLGEQYEHTIKVYGEAKYTDGSLSVELGRINGSEDNTYSWQGRYYYNPKTGEGHTETEWEKICVSLKPTDKGTEGEIRQLGLGNWCKYIYHSVNGWSCLTLSADGIKETFEDFR